MASKPSSSKLSDSGIPAFFSRTELSVKDALKGSAGRSGSYWYFCSEVPKGFWSRLNFC